MSLQFNMRLCMKTFAKGCQRLVWRGYFKTSLISAHFRAIPPCQLRPCPTARRIQLAARREGAFGAFHTKYALRETC
jgi:hypothetical protein